MLGGASCATRQPLPPVDFSAPGWHVRQGQAVWRPDRNRPEITGDLVVALNNNGDFFVQFLKTPLPIVTAESVGGAWQIEFGANEHQWHGQGAPPTRFGWFQLSHALAGQALNGNWQSTSADTNSFHLQNTSTGESLEGEFFP